MRYLAVDIGTRRTGVAYLDTEVGVPMPLETLHHTSEKQLVDTVMAIFRDRKVHMVLVGLPRLPSGEEGAQARKSRKIGTLLSSSGVHVEYLDERYTTPRLSHHKNAISYKNIDCDATAACSLLNQKFSH